MSGWTMRQRRRTVLFAAAVIAALWPSLSALAQADVPLPRPSPARAAATPQPAEEQPATEQDRLLLQGANSPFASAGADEPEARTQPLGTAATPQPDDTAAASVEPAPLQPLSAGGAPAAIRPGAFTLEARLWAGGASLGDGVKWRIFDERPQPDGKLPLLGEADGGVIHIRLEPGAYLVHAAYGRAGATKRIEVNDPTGGEVVVMNAGGMRLLAVNARDQQLRQGEVHFDIYAPDEGGSDERFLIVSEAPPGRIVSLNAGTYHVVCTYGRANAIVRADIRVDPGQLTEATIFQRAARLTLKLVEQHGGEAIANTEWSVATEAGEVVVESVGAFPNVVLAEGEYIAIARNTGRIFESTFTVEAGVHRDLEVLAQQ